MCTQNAMCYRCSLHFLWSTLESVPNIVPPHANAQTGEESKSRKAKE